MVGAAAKCGRVQQRVDLADGFFDFSPIRGRQTAEHFAQRAGFAGVVDDRQHVAAGQEQDGAGDAWFLLGGGGGQDSAHRHAHDADMARGDFASRGQDINRAPHVLHALSQGLGKQFWIGGYGPGAAGQTALGVVGQLEPQGGNAAGGQRGALQLGQLETAAQNVQADHGRPRRRSRLDGLGQVEFRRDRIVLGHRTLDRRGKREAIDAKRLVLAGQLHAVIERRLVVSVGHADGFGGGPLGTDRRDSDQQKPENKELAKQERNPWHAWTFREWTVSVSCYDIVAGLPAKAPCTGSNKLNVLHALRA